MEIKTEDKDKFIKVLRHSQGIPESVTMDVEPLFQKWAKNKEYFYQAFGNKLIYETEQPVTCHLDSKQRKFKYTCFIEKVREYWNNKLLADYLEALPPDDLFNNLISLNIVLASNNTAYNYKGRKLLKSFKYFESDKNLLFDMQNEASRIIQEDKVTGILCFSIHPLDFLSASENDHQWRSCHALDGDYRAGNLSYMVDTSTFICYLRSEDGYTHKLPNFPDDVPWNSKKWRRLLFLSNDRNMMFAGRPYPFYLSESLHMIDQYCSKFFCKESFYGWTQWHHGGVNVSFNNETLFEQQNGLYIVGHRVLKDGYELFKEPAEPLHFNDLTSSSCYTPWYTYRRRAYGMPCGMTSPQTEFYIGEDVPCPVCGTRTLSSHDVMTCMRCWHTIETELNHYHCSCCGNVVSDQLVLFVQDEAVCPTCYEDETSYCDKCGERYFNSDITYDRTHEMYLCPWCQRALEEEGETE